MNDVAYSIMWRSLCCYSTFFQQVQAEEELSHSYICAPSRQKLLVPMELGQVGNSAHQHTFHVEQVVCCNLTSYFALERPC